MKVVVVGDNKKDREKVAKAIKDKYEGLAEMNEGLRDNKRYLENDLALKMEQIAALEVAMKEERVRIVTGQFNQICGYCGEEMTAPSQWEKLQDHIQKCKKHPLSQAREQIAALTAENKKLFEEGTSIMHDQGAENILLKEQIATLIAKRDEGFELAMTESAPDYERVPRLYSLVHHLQAEIEKLKLEMNRMVRY